VRYLWPWWRRLLVRALVLVLALGAAPLNCLAAQPADPPPPAPALAAAIQQAVQLEVGTMKKVSPNAAQQSGASAAEPARFFKTKAGVVALVLLAAGTGYALYSTSHDRIKSPKVPYGGTWK